MLLHFCSCKRCLLFLITDHANTLAANHAGLIRPRTLSPKSPLFAGHLPYDLATTPPSSDAKAALTTHNPSGSADDSLPGCCQLLLQGGEVWDDKWMVTSVAKKNPKRKKENLFLRWKPESKVHLGIACK